MTRTFIQHITEAMTFDPDVSLAEQERILRDMQAAGLHETARDVFELLPVSELCATDRELVYQLGCQRTALKHWLAAGGRQPDWTKSPLAAKYHL